MLLRSYSFKQHQKGVFAMTCQVKQRHKNSSVISNARGSSYPPIYAKKWEKKIVELTSSNVKTNIEKSREIRRIILFTAETFCIMCHMESIWFMVFEEVLYDTFFGRFYFIFQMKDYNIISVPLCVCVCLFALSSLWRDMNFVFFSPERNK